MKYRFACSEMHPGCPFEVEDEREDAVLAAAEEHLKTTHPDEAIERDKIRASLFWGSRSA